VSKDVEVQSIGGEFHAAFPAHSIECEITRISDSSRGLRAELLFADVRKGGFGKGAALLFRHRLDLLGPKTAGQLASDLATKVATPEVPWPDLCEELLFQVVELYRAGGTTVDLSKIQPMPTRWVAEPFLEKAGPTTLFGAGGSGKSLLGLAMSISIHTGSAFIAKPTIAGPVLYLDWEADAEVHADRLKKLSKGWGLVTPPILYRRMTASLPDAAPYLRQEIIRHAAIAVIVDSMGLARGGEPESAESTLKLFAAIRSLDAAPICIDHMSKEQMRQRKGRRSPFGSIYTENASRNTWSVQAPEDPPDTNLLEVVLTHQKSNNGQRNMPIGLEIAFSDEEITLKRKSVSNMPDFAADMPLRDRIRSSLRQGPMSSADVVDDLGEESGSVRQALSKLKAKGDVVKLDGGQYGLAGNDW
jgi:hypothetical protein